MLLNMIRNPSFWRTIKLQKNLPICSVRLTTTNAVELSFAEEKEKLQTKLKEGLPQPYDGPERDLINFPKRQRLVYSGKTRFYIFPDEWFTFFYKKTGVTGPYVFGGGLLTFLLSKELYVIEDEFSTGVAMFILIWMVMKKFGPAIKEWARSLDEAEKAHLNSIKSRSMEHLEDAMKNEKTAQWQAGVGETIIAAKKENVLIQLETEYRRRLTEVYQQVKKRLDYHLDIDNTRKKLEQKHMVEWIVSNVVKSITPQQEKEALQKCLSDLKALSARV